MVKCIYCDKKGEKHHVVYKSQGGLDIPINYVFFCEEHHRGKKGPHRNRVEDIKLKLQMQEELMDILNKEYYTSGELERILGVKKSMLRSIPNIKISKKEFKYNRYDIIKFIMGGRFYSEYMLDSNYDDEWQCYEEDLYKLMLKAE